MAHGMAGGNGRGGDLGTKRSALLAMSKAALVERILALEERRGPYGRPALVKRTVTSAKSKQAPLVKEMAPFCDLSAESRSSIASCRTPGCQRQAVPGLYGYCARPCPSSLSPCKVAECPNNAKPNNYGYCAKHRANSKPEPLYTQPARQLKRPSAVVADEDFPWRRVTKARRMKDFVKLQLRIHEDDVTFPLSLGATVGRKVSNAIFQYERLKVPTSQTMSIVQYWSENKQKIKEGMRSATKGKTLKEKNDIYNDKLTHILGMVTQFPPLVAGLLYRHFNASCVLDPCAGWGDRLTAALALGCRYVGFDTNARLLPLYKELVKLHGGKRTTDYIIYHGKCQELVTDALLKREQPELVFTSPPFWAADGSMLEVYEDAVTDYREFLQPFVAMTKRFLERGILVCYHIPNNMQADVAKELGRRPFGFIPLKGKCGRHEIVYSWKHRPTWNDKQKVLPLSKLDAYPSAYVHRTAVTESGKDSRGVEV